MGMGPPPGPHQENHETMRRKIQIFDVDEMNEILKEVNDLSFICPYEYEEAKQIYGKVFSLGNFSCLKVCPKNITLTTTWSAKTKYKPVTFHFTTTEEIILLRQGCECYQILKRSAGEYIPDLSKDKILNLYIGKTNRDTFSNVQAGIQYYNPKFDKQKVYVYGYDLNSAYLSIMKDRMVDTREPVDFNRNVNEGEVGFIFDSNLTLIDKPGFYADIIFNEIDTPESLKKYCERWYQRKCSKDEKEKREAKSQIVNSIGYLQRKNPYLRSYIISKCNKLIKSLMSDDTTVLCNTDAIYSTIPLPQLKIGTELGEWKYDEGYITLDKLNYQSEVFGNVQRGKLKKEIKYEFDRDTCQLVKVGENN